MDDKTKLIGGVVIVALVIWMALRQRQQSAPAAYSIGSGTDTTALEAIYSGERQSIFQGKIDALKTWLAADLEKTSLEAQRGLAADQLETEAALSRLQTESGERVSLANISSTERASLAKAEADRLGANYAREVALQGVGLERDRLMSAERVATTLANTQSQTALEIAERQLRLEAQRAATTTAQTNAQTQAELERARIQAEAARSANRSSIWGTLLGGGLSIVSDILRDRMNEGSISFPYRLPDDYAGWYMRSGEWLN